MGWDRRRRARDAGGGTPAAVAPAATPTGAPTYTTSQLALKLFPLYLTHVNQAILTTMPFTLAVYMVRDFERAGAGSVAGVGAGSASVETAAGGGGGVSEATVGRLTGLLAAVFCAAQLVTSFPWGMISDRIGRKPVMVVGNVSCVASVLAFGLATSYAQAIVARVAGGALNAIILAEKAILGEGVPRDSQAIGFGLLSLCWGLGSLAGPLIGGALSAPCATALRIDALCGEGGLLAARPYFLPCFVAGLLSALSTVLTITSLEETLPSRRRLRDGAGGGGSRDAVAYQQVAASEEEQPPASRAQHGAADGGAAAGVGLAAGDGPAAPAAAAARTAASGGEVELGPVGSPTLSDISNGELGGGKPGSARRVRPFRDDSASLGSRIAAVHPARGRLEPAGEEELEEEEGGQLKERAPLLDSPASLEGAAAGGEQAGAEGPAGDAGGAKGSAAAGAVPWYRQQLVILALIGYGLIAWLFNILDEVTPIFASAAVADGGLGLSPIQLAPSLSFGGAVLVLWALNGYPWLCRRMGVVRVLRMGLWHAAPLALLMPVTSVFRGAQVPTQALLVFTMGCKAIIATNAFTSCLILVNASAPPGTLGAVNGVGQSIASLVRAAGPALGGLSWGWSMQLAGLSWWPSWLPHQFLPFALVALIALGTDLVYWHVRLPEEEAETEGARKNGADAV